MRNRSKGIPSNVRSEQLRMGRSSRMKAMEAVKAVIAVKAAAAAGSRHALATGKNCDLFIVFLPRALLGAFLSRVHVARRYLGCLPRSGMSALTRHWGRVTPAVS